MRHLSGAVSLVAVAMLAAPVALIREDLESTGLLESIYATKAIAVAILGAVLLVAFARLPDTSARTPQFVVAGIFALCGAALMAALISPFPDAALRGSGVRVLLPLVALSLAVTRFPASRVVPVTVSVIATMLAVAALLEGFGLSTSPTVLNAPGATLAHRNNLAFHFVIALPLLLCLAAEARGTERAAWVAAAATVGGALVLTRCRTGWAAVIIGIGIAWLWSRWRPRIVCGVIAAGALLMLLQPASFRTDVKDRALAAGNVHDEAWTCRSQLWRDTLEHVHDRPWVGHGPGAYVAHHADRIVCRPDHPHNDLLTAAFELGVPGAAALGLLILGLPVVLVRRRRYLAGALPASLAGSLVAAAAFGITNSPLALAPSAAWYWLVYGTALQLVSRPTGAKRAARDPLSRRAIVVVVVGVTAAFWLFGRAPWYAPPPQELAPDMHMNRAGTHVAFVVRGQDGISVLRLQDRTIERIRTAGDDARRPILSPEARRIAYETADDIVVFDRVTGDRRVIASRDTSRVSSGAAAWSPDGRHLAFRRTGAGNVDELILYEVETDAYVPLFAKRGTPVELLSFSPDGLRITFVSGSDTWIVPLDPDKKPRLLPGPSNSQPLRGGAPDGGPPAWSPNGRRIAYSVWSGGCRRIAVVDDVSGATARLANPPMCASNPQWIENWRIRALRRDRSGNGPPNLWTLALDKEKQDWSGRVAFGPDVAVHWYALDAQGDFLMAAARPGDSVALWHVTRSRKGERHQYERLFAPEHAALANPVSRRIEP